MSKSTHPMLEVSTADIPRPTRQTKAAATDFCHLNSSTIFVVMLYAKDMVEPKPVKSKKE